LARALAYPVGFFYLDDCEPLSADSVSFRSLSSLTARQRDAALASGTIAFLLDDKESVDYGDDEGLVFSLETPVDGRPATAGNGVHIAFTARDRDVVNGFYELALRLGGRDAGPPGLRSQYSEDYYGAFVFDPDGNKIEAVVTG